MPAAMSEMLPVSMLLGTDDSELMALLGKEPAKVFPKQCSHNVFAVITLVQAHQQRRRKKQLQEYEEASRPVLQALLI